MTFTWIENEEKSSYDDREFPVIVQNELRQYFTEKNGCFRVCLQCIKTTPRAVNRAVI